MSQHEDEDGKPLKPIEIPGASTTGDIGGQVKVLFQALLPYGLGKKAHGLWQVSVLDQNSCPMLFPMNLCRTLGLVLDTPAELAIWKFVKAQSKLNIEPSGHISINVLEIAETGWKDPRHSMASHQWIGATWAMQLLPKDTPDTYHLDS